MGVKCRGAENEGRTLGGGTGEMGTPLQMMYLL